MKTIDPSKLPRLAELIGEEYERLYGAPAPVPGYKEAVDNGNAFMGRNIPLMRQLASIREDFIASDREVAALWFALKRMEEEDGPASHGIPADMTRLVKQECDCCGKVFTVRYHSNGTYDYVDEPCDCEANFSPVDGEPSISQWLEALK